MHQCKYIIFRAGGMETPILFPATLQHRDVAEKFSEWKWESISAGFVDRDEASGKIRAFGESLTLMLKSRPEDTDLISVLLGI